ncbi:MAG: efflux RND transporter periplasmic adaptor subunit [Sphingobacteriia bacterium]|nr:efflux RND transporter periplasmic adaptor subunit [Sphingobacteriia bacterium]
MNLLKKNFKLITIVITLIVIMAARLITNKESFDREQKLASETSGAVPVLAAKATLRPIDNSFIADGLFVANREVKLSAEIAGRVTKVIAMVGDHVHTGALLAEIDNRVLTVQLQQAKANLQKLEKDMQRNESLVKSDGVTLQQYEQSKQEVITARATLTDLQNQYDNSFIRAPFDGTITHRDIELGSYLSPGNELFSLSTTSFNKLVVNLSTEQLGLIEKGRTVVVTADDIEGETLKGKVSSINERANASNQFEVEISLESDLNGRIKPGMFGKASFVNANGRQALIIPRTAIQGSIKDAEVYVVKGDSVVVTKITVAILNTKEVIVTSGLTENDLLVVSGQINLTNGTKVKTTL